MEAAGILPVEKLKTKRIAVLWERRISSHEPCSTCGSRRKTWVDTLGWVCTSCFDRCKENAELLVEAGSGASRLRQAYELAVYSYRAAHAVPSGQQDLALVS
jgi:hypothetical protein